MTFDATDLLALISGEDNVGDQWRVIHPYRRLRQAGISARYYWGDDHDAQPTDPEQTVLVVRLMTGTDPRTLERWVTERRAAVRAIVYELDDVTWGDAMVTHLEDAGFMRGKSRAELIHQGEMAKHLAGLCDGIITSSETLAEMVRRDVHPPVVTVPNAIDVRWFRAQMAHRAPWADHLTIGWAGGRRPEADVEAIAIAWGRIAKRYPAVHFVLAAALVPDVFYREIEDDSRIIRLPWVPWAKSPELYQVDIGCCAVADTPFSRAKTPIKWMEYATAGAAVVATPTDGSSGLLAESADAWEAAIASLIEDEDRRRFIRDVGRSHVERYHGLDVNLHRWTDAYAEIVAQQYAGVA